MRQRKIIPGVDPKLLIKDAAKLMPDPTRRWFLRGAASLGALAFLTGCDIIDGDTAEGVLRKVPNSTTARRRCCSAAPSSRRLSRKRHHPAVPLQRLLRRGRSAGSGRQNLQARGRRTGREQEPWTLDELHALPEVSQITRQFVLRAGARSAHGRARRCRNSSSASAPTRAPNTSGSNAPRATPTRSTCRPRCIRRRR